MEFLKKNKDIFLSLLLLSACIAPSMMQGAQEQQSESAQQKEQEEEKYRDYANRAFALELEINSAIVLQARLPRLSAPVQAQEVEIKEEQDVVHAATELCARGAAKNYEGMTAKKIHESMSPEERRSHICPMCNAYCTSNMVRHLMIHTGEKPYECTYPECKKRFRARSTLQMHLHTHEGKKPYKCRHAGCGKTFTQSSNLLTHRRKYHGDMINRKRGQKRKTICKASESDSEVELELKKVVKKAKRAARGTIE